MARFGHLVNKETSQTGVLRFPHNFDQVCRKIVPISFQEIFNAIAHIATIVVDNKSAIAIHIEMFRRDESPENVCNVKIVSLAVTSIVIRGGVVNLLDLQSRHRGLEIDRR